MIVFDHGLIPYKSHYRKFLYKLFPKRIKYVKKGVVLPGMFWYGPSMVPSTTLSKDDKFKTIGNLYEMDEEVFNFMKRTVKQGLLSNARLWDTQALGGFDRVRVCKIPCQRLLGSQAELGHNIYRNYRELILDTDSNSYINTTDALAKQNLKRVLYED